MTMNFAKVLWANICCINKIDIAIITFFLIVHVAGILQ